MIILDANILLYAYDQKATLHLKAKTWISKLFSSSESVGLPWQTIGAFLRVVSNPTLPGQRFQPEEAVAIVDSWLDQPNVVLLAPGQRHWTTLGKVILEGQARGPLITDAQLAALTIEHGGVLYSTDRDFGRFPGLRWINPLL